MKANSQNQENVTKDGEDIVKYLSEMSIKARSVGRNVVFAVIATSWALAYNNNVFSPIPLVVWALTLAIIYVFFDLLYYVLTTAIYKYILINFLEPTKRGFQYKKGKDASQITRKWMNVGFVWIVVMSLLLFASSILLILHILSLVGAYKVD